MARSEFTQRVIALIRSIPPGRVATYGNLAARAGNPRAARQVVRVLHTCSETEDLPWHRVINREGRISLKPGRGFEEQQALLEDEGVACGSDGRVDLARFLWEHRPH